MALKLEDFENWPCRNNLQVQGFPEASLKQSRTILMQKICHQFLLTSVLKQELPQIEFERVHHVLEQIKHTFPLPEHLLGICSSPVSLQLPSLTALRSDEVIDLMIKEYPNKHAEYSVILQEKERQRLADHYKEYSQLQQQNTQKVEPSKVPEYIKKAAKKAAEFNSNLNRERMEERRAYFDLQTHIIQVPQGNYKVLPSERTKVGPYPVSLIPGQFQEYYKRYSPDELRYLPLNTALYEPPLDPELLTLDSDGDSEDAEDDRCDEKRKNKGSSDSSSGNVSEGENPIEIQEDSFQGRQKGKDKPTTPKKEGSKLSALSKSVPGYKVEEKSP
ncbi:PHD finger protein 10-like [Microcaecilia unicolor]|uniref:PHD finger protein 10-like n=1 Tax=Microcaecilia unicolor TaxID=1415580 RepID=A0A6P7WWT0_9AMPH|nr:PHD finger protein 10-like [Microcaecilia unicolor]